jgi:hypothetical protein
MMQESYGTQEYCVYERERERRNKWEVMRDTTFGGSKKESIFSDFKVPR